MKLFFSSFVDESVSLLLTILVQTDISHLLDGSGQNLVQILMVPGRQIPNDWDDSKTAQDFQICGF